MDFDTPPTPAGRTDIQIAGNGDVTASGKIRQLIEEAIVNGDWKQELSGFVKEMTEIKKTYVQCISGDGRLVGVERSDLADQLDDALNHVVMIRALIEGDPNFIVQDANSKYTHRMDVRMEKNRWNGSGNVGKFRRVNLIKFPQWLDSMYKKIQELVAYMGVATADGVIDAQEKAKINQMLDRMAFSIILIRELIQQGDIH